MVRLRNVYLYLVSFVSLMMILIGIIFTVQSATDVFFPTNYNYYPPVEQTDNSTAEDIKIKEEYQKNEQENQRNNSKKNVVKSFAVVVVGLPTFIYHWRKIEKEKREV